MDVLTLHVGHISYLDAAGGVYCLGLVHVWPVFCAGLSASHTWQVSSVYLVHLVCREYRSAVKISTVTNLPHIS